MEKRGFKATVKMMMLHKIKLSGLRALKYMTWLTPKLQRHHATYPMQQECKIAWAYVDEQTHGSDFEIFLQKPVCV